MKYQWSMYVLLWLLAIGVVGCGESNPVSEDAREVPAVDPFEMNQRLGRGVNFGNALEAPNEGEWGVTLSSLHFDRAKEAGFNTIRLPVRWSNHAQTSAPYAVNNTFFNRVDWAIDQATSRDMNLILNVHHYEEMASAPEAHKERWLALWRQIAERYRNYPETLLFELLNEPNSRLNATLWNEMVADGIDVIRASNPTRNLIIGPVSWNNSAALRTLQLPDDDHIIVTVHFYEPFQFTHQGAEWVSGADAWLNTAWTGTASEKAFVTDILEQATDWGAEHNRPLFVGEFGAYSRADLISRVRWTDFVARECERLGMSWSYWEFMSGFGIYDLDTDTFRQELLFALIPPTRS